MTAVPGKVRDPAPPRLPQRPIGSRLSFGHLAILLVGVVAAVLTYAVLRGGSTVEVTVAARPLAAGDVVEASSFRYETLRLPKGSGGLLTKADAAAAVKVGDRMAVPVDKGALVARSMVAAPNQAEQLLLPVLVESLPEGIARYSRVDVAIPAKPGPPVLSGVTVWNVRSDVGSRYVEVLVDRGQEARYNTEVKTQTKLRVFLIVPAVPTAPATGNG